MSDIARRLLRGAVHAAAGAAVGLCLLLPGSSYEWVREIAPDLAPDSFADGGDRSVALAACLTLAAVLEGLAAATARTPWERRLPLTLLLGVIAVAAWRGLAG